MKNERDRAGQYQPFSYLAILVNQLLLIGIRADVGLTGLTKSRLLSSKLAWCDLPSRLPRLLTVEQGLSDNVVYWDLTW